MGGTTQTSCGIEFSKEFKEYPEYPHFNFAMMSSLVFNKSGTLPFAGGLADQPAQIMDILEVIFELDSEREADLQRKAEKDRSRK
jgi:hypothetical protein